MANTDNTRTTRRAILTGIAATTAATAALAVPAASATTTDVDAVLAAWRAWRPLTEEWMRLDDEVTRIEKSMPAWVREGPDIRIGAAAFLHPGGFDEAIGRLPDWLKPASEQIRECAMRGWNEGWSRVEEERARRGLTWRQERMDQIVELQDPLITLMEDAVGSHPIVVAAKIDGTLSEAPHHAELEERTWSFCAAAIRGLLAELPADMAEALAPIAAGEGTIREVYTGRRSAGEGRSA